VRVILDFKPDTVLLSLEGGASAIQLFSVTVQVPQPVVSAFVGMIITKRRLEVVLASSSVVRRKQFKSLGTETLSFFVSIFCAVQCVNIFKPTFHVL
jgi:hypothetical protein